MNRHIPFKKLSKREQQKLNKKRRGTWGAINPVSRKTKNMKAYDRKRDRKLHDDVTSDLFFVPSQIDLLKYWQSTDDFHTRERPSGSPERHLCYKIRTAYPVTPKQIHEACPLSNRLAYPYCAQNAEFPPACRLRYALRRINL